MPAEHQRGFLDRGKGPPNARGVFLIEEKACQTPESFLDRGKGQPSTREFSLSRKRSARLQRPEGSRLSWKRTPIRTRAPEGLASGTFFVPFAHRDRAGPALGRFYYIFLAATAGSIIVK